MTTSIEHNKKVAKPMLWISMASMAMVFAGLTSAYVVRKAEGNWLDFDFPIWFYISAIVIALSSVTMILAKRAIKHSDNKKSLTNARCNLRFWECFLLFHNTWVGELYIR